MMERRYEAYKQKIVKPFFVEHFSRLDRQIVLVDALAAFNAGPQAVRDLETALASVLSAFRVGANSWLSALFRPRVQKILFAATKADHLHHTSHDRLEAILRRLADGAIERASFAGAAVDVVALASVRATREAMIKQGRSTLPSIIGTPMAGESAGGEIYRRRDRNRRLSRRAAGRSVEPSSMPGAFCGMESGSGEGADYRFLRFRPPKVAAGPGACPISVSTGRSNSWSATR